MEEVTALIARTCDALASPAPRRDAPCHPGHDTLASLPHMALTHTESGPASPHSPALSQASGP
jgi:hypothetical protein